MLHVHCMFHRPTNASEEEQPASSIFLFYCGKQC
jgi:hypothetical protein